MDKQLQLAVTRLLKGMVSKKITDDFDEDDDYESAIEDYPTSNENENLRDFQDPSKSPHENATRGKHVQAPKDVKGSNIQKFSKGGQVEAVGIELEEGEDPKVTKMEGDPEDVLKAILGKITGEDCSPEDEEFEAEFKKALGTRKMRK